nr:M1 family metallopeptidase [Chitinophagaceae bacterium]
MSTQKYLYSTLLLLLCVGCMSTKKLNKIYQEEKKLEKPPVNIAIKEVKVTPVRKDNFRTTPNKFIDILHADINVKFNWGLHQCIGTETILLKPYFYETDSILLDAKSMIFDGIKIEDMQQNPIQYLVSYDKKILNLKLERKLKASDTVLLTIHYIAKPDENEKGAGKAIRDDKGLYFINTDHSETHKPMQVWTQGETESNSCWFPTIDKPNEKFTSTLTIQTTKDFTTLSNGELVSSVIEDNVKTEVWKNVLPMPAYLTMMAVGNFTITKDLWTLPADTNNTDSNYVAPSKEVSYYLEPEYEPYARGIFANTIEMLQFFSDRLGVLYPWNKYAQVVVRDFVSGAMENTSATLHGDFVQKNARELVENNNEGIISHELFHQWFGDLVTCESWSHVSLNEGFASYGEQLWIEHKYGRDAGLKKCFQSMERYIKYASDNEDMPIINYNYKDKDDMFNAITYQKGARVLHLLRTELGDDAFFLALKKYLNDHAFGNAEIDDLRKEFESVSGKDLRPFFQQWYLRGGHPIIEIRYDYNDSTKLLGVYIEQKQAAEIGLYTFPLKFKVTQGAQTKNFVFNIEKRKESFFVQKFDESVNTFPNVIVDPEAVFIGEIIDNRPFFNQILTYNTAGSYVEKMRSLSALSVLQKQLDTVRFTILSAINDPDDDIRLKALQWVDWNNADNYSKTKDILIYQTKNDASAAVRAEATKILGNKKDPLLLNYFVELTNDSSYSVAGNALEAVYAILPDEGFRLAAKLDKDVKGKLFEQVCHIYSQMGDQFSLNFFKENVMKFHKGNRAKLIEKYTLLLLKLNISSAINEAVEIFKVRATSDISGQVRFTGMKALKEIINHKIFASKQTNDQAQMQTLLDEASALNNELQQIMVAEQESDVKNLLKINGLYTETTE